MGIKKPSTYISQYAIYLVWTLLVKKGKANFFLYSGCSTVRERCDHEETRQRESQITVTI